MLTTEPGIVFGERTPVHLWPAAALDQPDRRPHHAGPIRPLRCHDMDGVYVYVLYASGHERFYADGRPERWQTERVLAGTTPDVLYRLARRHLITASLGGARVTGVSFLIGPVPRYGKGRWGSNWFMYPVVPAAPTLALTGGETA